MYKNGLRKKLREAVVSVLPIAAIVLILCAVVTPVATDTMLAFIVGTGMLIFGLGVFAYGAENSMTKIGNLIGSKLTATRREPLILILSFALGAIITIAEPDLAVLSDNVPHINSLVLKITIAVGVGLFLTLSMWRILHGFQLRIILIVSYVIVFILAAISDPRYLAVAFDAGGVTTGPMTAPFIMAMGIGVAAIRSDRNAEADSFGLVGLCSVGPILAVLILGFFYKGEEGIISAAEAGSYADTFELSASYVKAVPHYIFEAGMSLLPVALFFLAFQIFSLKLSKLPLIRILAGMMFTYTGLVIFLTGVNVGFSSMGVILGRSMAGGWKMYLLVPVAILIGWFIVKAEPAVIILTKQVEEISAGAVSEKAMNAALSVAIASAAGIAMLRALTGINLYWFLIPGYAVSLILCSVVPQIFTAIAFDAGGVASGPMSTTFMLPFVMGACQASGGNILTDAFGCVALIALMPPITVQIMGLITVLRSRRAETVPPESFDDDEIIELWEV